jgi:hypothetical protein
VTARNGCGETRSADHVFGDGFDAGAAPPSPGAVFTFTTAPLAGDCEPGSARQVLFAEDVESGAPGWGLGGDVNGLRWTIGGIAHGGSHAFVADNNPFLAMQQPLLTPPIVLPAGLSKITLSFFNQQSLEGVPGNCHDGAVLNIFPENVFSPEQITEGLLTDPYDGPVNPITSSPISNQPAWCADPQPYLDSRVDLTPYAGQTVQLQFLMVNETRGESESAPPPNPGWAIDDVTVFGCSAR